MRLFTVPIPIFCRDIIVCIDCSATEANAAIYEYTNKKIITIFEDQHSGGVLEETDLNIYMWVEDTNKASIVFHELVHVAFSICTAGEIKPDEELIAYLVGWLKINIADKIYYFKEVSDV